MDIVSDNRLSPFHAELLDFLRRDVTKRCAEEGYDPALDLPLQNLLKGLSPTSSDGSLPLTEIIDNYQHLFSARGPIHIEKILMEAFPTKEFIDLSLTRYYPRMYRGLPRLYHRSHPSQFHIKKNFTHLPSLKRQACVKALFSLYGNYEVHNERVTIFTWVISDGLGDYVAAVEAIQILQAHFPDLQLQFVALVPKGVSSLPHPSGSIIIPYEQDCPLELIPQEALTVLRSSDLILQIPTFYPHTAGLIETLKAMPAATPMPKMEQIGEYGFLESSWFHPKSGNYSMGLHFLEKGILVRKPYVGDWDDLENEQLKQWHRPENHFYLAYLTTPIGGAIYLHALLKSLENDPKGIDLCVPYLGWFTHHLEKQEKAGRSVLEWDVGVKEIQIYFKERIHVIPIAGEGKTVRFLSPDSVSQADFRALMTLSGDFVAVRGDQSFSEAVCAGKPFFYDGREHARYFMKDLVALAENRISSHPTALTCIRGMNQGFLYNLPVQEEDWVDEVHFQEIEEWTAIALSMGLALQDPDTAVGYRKLNQLIAREFPFNPFLCHLVQRALCHRHDDLIERLEEDEVVLFTANSQSFAQMIENQRRRLG